MLQNNAAISLKWQLLTCCAVVANAISAGGLLMCIPAVAHSSLELSDERLSIITAANSIGFYALAAIAGVVADRRGVWTCSLATSILSALGLGGLQRIISSSSGSATLSKATFIEMVICFGIIGAAQSTSHYSCILAAIKTFPRFIGTVVGTSLVINSVSPLFHTAYLSTFVTKATDDERPTNDVKMDFRIDASGLLPVVAIFASVTHLLSTLILRQTELPVPTSSSASDIRVDSPVSLGTGEETHENGPDAVAGMTQTAWSKSDNILDFIKQSFFWILFTSVTLVFSVSNVFFFILSSMVLNRAPSFSNDMRDPESIGRFALRVVVIRTFSPLAGGMLSDVLSPAPPSHAPNTRRSLVPRPREARRAAFIFVPIAVIGAASAWASVASGSPEALGLVGAAVGMMNGWVSAAVPGMVSAAWGPRHLGRNLAIFSYTSCFAWGALQVIHKRSCEDDGCWERRLVASACVCLAACAVPVLLGKQWRTRV